MNSAGTSFGKFNFGPARKRTRLCLLPSFKLCSRIVSLEAQLLVMVVIWQLANNLMLHNTNLETSHFPQNENKYWWLKLGNYNYGTDKGKQQSKILLLDFFSVSPQQLRTAVTMSAWGETRKAHSYITSANAGQSNVFTHLVSLIGRQLTAIQIKHCFKCTPAHQCTMLIDWLKKWVMNVFRVIKQWCTTSQNCY